MHVKRTKELPKSMCDEFYVGDKSMEDGKYGVRDKKLDLPNKTLKTIVEVHIKKIPVTLEYTNDLIDHIDNKINNHTKGL
jgi:hypothetical protein